MCEKSPGRFSFVHAYNLFRVKTANRGALLPLFFNDRHAVSAQRISPAILAPEASPPNEYICDMKINCSKCQQKKFDWFQTLRNNMQKHATTCNRVCKRTQHVTSNKVGSCWPTILRPFVRGLIVIGLHPMV